MVDLGVEEQLRTARAGSSVGLNGRVENRIGKLGSVTLGGITIDAPEVVFYGEGTGYDKEAWGMRIGNAFLKDFVVTVDYRRRTITLQRP